MRKAILVAPMLLLAAAAGAQTFEIVATPNDTLCITTPLTLQLNAYPSPTAVDWAFGADASMATASGQGPHQVTFDLPGRKAVVVSHSYTGVSRRDTVYIEISRMENVELVVDTFPSSRFTALCHMAVADAASIGPHAYRWKIDSDSTPFTLGDSIREHRFREAGSYPIEASVRDAAGCRFDAQATFDATPVFSAPNVFTPNGDGVNDIFAISSDGLTSYSLTIYDRWGGVVYQPNILGTQLVWDGRNNAGTIVKPGVYYYVVEPVDPAVEPLRGVVHIFHDMDQK